jgi:ABC-type spermidine/putrescine transport system permease subunit I
VVLPRLSSRLARLKALTPQQRQLFVAASIFLPLLWISLRCLGLVKLLACLDKFRKEALAPTTRHDMRAMAESVRAAATVSPFPTSCLTRSLLLRVLLHRRGVAAELRIGVRFAKGALDAHAWLEVDGVPINAQLDVSLHYAPFATLPPEAALGRQ